MTDPAPPPHPATLTWHDFPPLSRARWGVSFWVATITGTIPTLMLATYLTWEMNR